MNKRRRGRRRLCLVGLAILLSPCVAGGLGSAVRAASSAATASTPVDHETQWWGGGQSEVLGTVAYWPSKKEKTFFDRLSPDEITTGSPSGNYDILTKDKKYVGWFGIVRAIREDAAAGRTVLTVEHKYFDGLTDLEFLAVSFNGSGDFQAVLKGTGHRIPPLSLVKVYGVVAQAKKGGKPTIDAVFVRDWHWGAFTFLSAYGVQRGNESWRKANKIPLEEIYDSSPHPCHHYYEDRLGKRPDGPAIRKQLLDAAGPVSPEAQKAMERLADLLAVGHTWSKEESFRQMGEQGQIESILKKTKSFDTATRLLLEALLVNDERISFSATENIGRFDPSEKAVGTLIKLLAHENRRVRAGALNALWNGYRGNMASAVPTLRQFVAGEDAELRALAISVLETIGPDAKDAVPTLEKIVAEDTNGSRTGAAKAIWRITGNPDAFVRACVDRLETKRGESRFWAAQEIKDVGRHAASAVPALIKAMNDPDDSTRWSVTEAIGAIGPKASAAIPTLTGALKKDESTSVRAGAADALGKIGDVQSVPALLDAMKDGDSHVRGQVANALNALGDARAISVLIAAIKDEDDYARSCAMGALETFGPKAKAAIPALSEAVRHDTECGHVAEQALAAIDAEGVCVPVLIEALGGKDATLRRYAAVGLGRFGRKAAAAEKPLRDRLRDRDQGARVTAAAAYWAVSGKAEEAVQVLREVLRAPDDDFVHRWTTESLAQLGPAAKAAVPELTNSLRSEDESVAAGSATALGKIGPGAASAAPALAAELKNVHDEHTRVCLARALRRINHSEVSLPVLEKALDDSGDPSAVIEAAEAILDLGPRVKDLKPRLRRLLEHDDSYVRAAAAKVLKQLDVE